MKKKLLVVLLVIVMVFALVACKTDVEGEYNYFKDVYASMENVDDVRLHTMVYLQLQSMFNTPGKYLVYFGNWQDDNSKNTIALVNDAAIKYEVPAVYVFDPVLDGGVGADNGYTTQGGLDYTADLNDPGLGAVSAHLQAVANEIKGTLGGIVTSDKKAANYNAIQPLSEIPMGSLLYLNVSGAQADVFYDGSGGLPADTVGGWKDAELTKETRYSISRTVLDAAAPTKYFSDVVYGANSAFDKEATIASIESIVKMGCQRVPSAKANEEKYFSTHSLFDYFSDYRLHMVDGTGEAGDVSQFLADSGSVFQNITYHEFIRMLDAEDGMKGDFMVHFGGAWCPNTQAMAWLCDKYAKDYGIETIYLFDPRLAGSPTVLTQFAASGVTSVNLNIRTNDGANNVSFSYTGLYANLLMALGGDFTSEWNYAGGSGNYFIQAPNFDKPVSEGGYGYTGATVKELDADGKETDVVLGMPRMCVPNIMILNNDIKENRQNPKGKNKEGTLSKIVGAVECEYSYVDTSNENSLIRKYLDEALTKLFDKNENGFYSPIVEAAPAAEAGGGGGGAAPLPEAC